MYGLRSISRRKRVEVSTQKLRSICSVKLPAEMPDSVRGIVLEYCLGDILAHDVGVLEPLIKGAEQKVCVWADRARELAGFPNVRLRANDIDIIRQERAESLGWLNRAKSVRISAFVALNDSEMRHLRRCRAVFLELCDTITDAGFAHLAGVDELHLHGARKLTDEGLRHLSGARVLVLGKATQITQAGLRHLSGLGLLSLSEWHGKLTSEGLTHMRNIRDLVFCYASVSQLGALNGGTVRTIEFRHCSSVREQDLRELDREIVVLIHSCRNIGKAEVERLQDDGYCVVLGSE